MFVELPSYCDELGDDVVAVGRVKFTRYAPFISKNDESVKLVLAM